MGVHPSIGTAAGGLRPRLLRKPQPAAAAHRHKRSHSRCNNLHRHSSHQIVRAERQVHPQCTPARQPERQFAGHRDVHTIPRHLAAAVATVVLACSLAQPVEAFSKSGLSKALASAVRPQPTDAQEAKSKRTAELAHAPEVCHEETTLSKASTAAVSEMRMRAALFDEAGHKTAALRKRTSQFVDSMWQSLE